MIVGSVYNNILKLYNLFPLRLRFRLKAKYRVSLLACAIQSHVLSN